MGNVINMKVHIKSEYSIRDEDLPLLPDNKMRWWMKSEDNKDNPWIRFPTQQIGNNLLDVEVDLVPGRYSAGVGDYNVTNNMGWHVSQRVYFYLVPDGTVIYCKRYADLPSYEEVIDMADGDYVESAPKNPPSTIMGYDENTGQVDGIDYDKIEKSMTLAIFPFITYCRYPIERNPEDDEETFQTKKIKRTFATTCKDHKEIKPDAGYNCNNCIYSSDIYIDSEHLISE